MKEAMRYFINIEPSEIVEYFVQRVTWDCQALKTVVSRVSSSYNVQAGRVNRAI